MAANLGVRIFKVQQAGWSQQAVAHLIEHQKRAWLANNSAAPKAANDFIPDAVFSLAFYINRDQRVWHCAVFGLPQPDFGLLRQHARSSAAAAGCGKRMCATSPPPGATEKKLTFPRGRESRGGYASVLLVHTLLSA